MYASPGNTAAQEGLRNCYFACLLWSAAVVAVGVLLEGPEVVHGVSVFRHEEHLPAWVVSVALIGWMLVGIGVAGEFIAEGFTTGLSRTGK
jgi:hypothetical protein